MKNCVSRFERKELMANKKKGISLVFLVIIIIIMLILSSAVVITVVNNSPIEEANEAAIRTDIQAMKDKYELVYKDVLFKKLGDESKLKDSDFEDVVPDEYKSEFQAGKDGLEYIGDDETVKEIADDMGLGKEQTSIIEYVATIGKQSGVEIEVVLSEGQTADEYIYQIREKGQTEWEEFSSTENKLTIEDLKEDAEYEVKVIVKQGENEYESEIKTVVTKEVQLGTLTLKLNDADGEEYEEDTWTTENVYVEVSGMNTTYSVTGANTVDETSSATVLTNEGISTITVTTTSSISPKTKEYAVKIDRGTPVVNELVSSTTAMTNQDITIIGKAIDAQSGIVAYQFSTDANLTAASNGWKYIETTITEMTRTYTVTENNTYYFYVKDGVGNVAKKEIVIDFIDKTPPTTTVPTLTSTSNSISVIVKQTDENGLENGKIEVAIKKSDDDTWGQWIEIDSDSYTFESLTQDTSYDVKTRATDEAGNISESVVATLKTKKLEKPSLTIPDESWTNDGVDVIIKFSSISDSVVTNQYSIDGNTWEPVTGNEITVRITENNTTVYARVIDSTQQVSESATYQVTCIDKTDPTINSLEADIKTPTNQPITLTGEAIDKQSETDANDGISGIVAYQFSTADDLTKESSGWIEIESTTEKVVQTYEVTQNDTYYFYVMDDAGNISKKEIIIDYVDAQPPTLDSINVTSEAGTYITGDIVTIEATYSENIEGTAPTLTIKFGDGDERTLDNGTINGNKITYTYTVQAGDNGALTSTNYEGTVTDEAGNSLTVSNKTLGGNAITADTTAPTLNSLNVTSDAGIYKAGDIVTIEATYSENIEGTAPELGIKFGDGTERTLDNGTINGNKITYTYTVQAGDNGVLTSTNYEGTVTDEAGNSLTVTDTPLGGNAITADTTAPTLNSLNVTSNAGTYKAGDIVTIEATYSENIEGTAPELDIKFGTGSEITLDNGAINGNKITYTYTVQAGDNGALTSTNYEGTVTDEAGNSLTVEHMPLGGNAITADTTAPTLNSINVTSPAGTYKAGDTVTIEATYSENIEGTAPSLDIKFGDGDEITLANGVINGNKITYTYTVQAGDSGTLTSTDYVGTVTDEAGNSLTVEHMPLGGNTVTSDTTAPTLNSINVTSDAGTYKVGDTVTIEATYSENIEGTTPTLTIKFGDGDERVISSGTINGNKITYTYTVQAGDNGTLTSTNYEGTVTDELGNSLTVSHMSLGGNAITSDTAGPINTAPELTATTNAITVKFLQTDTNGIDNTTIQYAIKKTSDTTWGAWVTVGSSTYTFTDLDKDTSYDVKTKASDTLGNAAESTAATISTVNITSPVITAPKEWVSGLDGNTVTVTISYPEIDGTTKQYSVNSTEESAWVDVTSTTYEVEVDTNNTTVYARLKDSEGQVSDTASHTVTCIDSTAPIINSFTAEDDSPTNSAVTLTGKAIDEESGIVAYQFSTSDNLTATSTGWTEIASTTSTITQSYSASANTTYYFYVKNDADLVTKQSYTVNNIDKNAPTLSSINVKTPDSGTYKAGQVVTIEATYSENITGTAPTLTIKFGNGTERTATPGTINGSTIPYTYTIQSGDNGVLTSANYAGTVTDEAGNSLTVSNKTLGGNTITADTTAPATTAPTLTSTTNSITATFKQTDTNGIDNTTRQYAIKKTSDATWGAWITSNSGTYTFTGLDKDTSYDVRTKASDTIGNESVSTAATISTVNITSPEITAPTEWVSGLDGNTATVTISYPEIDGTTKQYSVNSTEESSWIDVTSTTYEVEVDTNNTTVYARLKDTEGQVSGTVSHTVTCIDPTAPNINSFTVEDDSPTNTAVTLIGKAIDEESGIVAYQFSESDGLTATSAGWTNIESTKTEITQEYSASTNTTYYFYVKNDADLVTKQSYEVTNIDTTNLTLNSINVTSPASGTYKAGEVVTMVATYNKNITGTVPTLKIKFGDGTERTISSGTISGNTITYEYTIQSGDNGTLASTSYTGTVTDEAGNSLTVSNKTLGGNTITADTTAPTLDSINVTSAAGTYKTGDIVTIEATYSEDISQTETAPTLTIKFGDGDERTLNNGTINGNKITYTYTVQDGDNGAITSTNYDGTVTDAAGNNLDVTNKTLGGNAITSDTTAPTLNSINVTSPTLGTYKAGQVITMVATYSENITGTAPTLKIKFGTGTERTISTGTISNNTITYEYTVQAGDNGTLTSTNYEGTVTDAKGNSLTVSNKTLGGNTIAADTTAPATTAPTLTSTTNSITATFKQTDTNGIDNTTRQYAIKKTIDTTWGAWITSNSGSYTFTGLDKDTSYDVRTKASDTLGNESVSTAATISTVNITSPEITAPTEWVSGLDGNTVTVTISYPEIDGTTKQYSVNSTEESSWIDVTSTTYEVEVDTNNTTVYARLKDTEDQVSGVASWEVTCIDPTAPNINGFTAEDDSPTNTAVTLIGKAIDEESGIVAYQFSTSDGLTATSTGWTNIASTKTEITQEYSASENTTYYFYVKNDADLVTKQSYEVTNIDTTNLTLNSINVTSPASGTYKAGEVVTMVATYNKNITGTAPTLKIKFGTGTERTISSGTISGSTIKYEYTIQSGDNGTLASTNYDGTVTDAAGNNLDVTNKTLGGNTITADTTAPTLNSINVTSAAGTYKIGDVVTIEATYSEDISQTETAPTLTIKFGDGAGKAATTVGINGNKITYEYTIQSGDNGTITSTNYDGTVTDAAGNSLDVTNKTLGGNSVTSDTKGPELKSLNVTAPAAGTYSAGQVVTIVATYSENITGTVPVLKVRFGSGAQREISTGTISDSTITYTYTIVGSDYGTLTSTAYTGTVTDTAGNTSEVTNITLGGNKITARTESILQSWSSGSTTDFHNSTYKSKITKAVFKDNTTVPSTAVASWDVSAAKNGSVMAYVEGDSTNGYTLTIGGNGTVYANSNSSYLFENFTALTTIEDIYIFDTSKTTGMNAMFSNCSKLTDLDVTYFDTSQVTDMTDMFYGCSQLTSLDLSYFNTSKVTSMYYMFADCSSLTSLDLSYFNTSQVTDMDSMFYRCTSLTDINFDGFDTSNVAYMGYMFEGCSSLTSLDLSSFDTSNISDMTFMFEGCIKLQEVILSDKFAFEGSDSYLPTPSSTYITGADGKWYNTVGKAYTPENVPSNVADTYIAVKKDSVIQNWGYDALTDFHAEAYRTKITKLVFKDNIAVPSGVTSWDVSQNSNGSVMAYVEDDGSGGYVLTIGGFGKVLANQNSNFIFNRFTALTQIQNMNLFDTSNVTNMSYMFSGCTILTSLDLSSFVTNSVTNMQDMFSGCTNLESLDLSSFITNSVTNMQNVFYDCSSLTSLDVSGFVTNNVTDMSNMFYNCRKLTALDFSHFVTSNVTDMEAMFKACAGLTSLNITSFNTSKVTTMKDMFEGCSSLTALDLTNFNTSQVTTMHNMFYNCNKLTSLDLSSFNTYNVTVMGNMFYLCSSLATLNLSNFDTSNITDMGSMFDGCIKLQEVVLGENFEFIGTDSYLPTPTASNITGADGYWYNSIGIAYTPENVPSNVADTYIAVKKDAIIKEWGVGSQTDFHADTYKTQITKVVFKSNTSVPSGATSWDVSKNSNGSVMAYVEDNGSGGYVLTIGGFGGNVYANPNSNFLFNGFTALTQIENMNLFDTSNVTNMSYMFYNCTGIKSLDVSSFNTSNVINMGNMFDSCKGLTSLNLSNINTSNVQDMSDMFYQCSSLTTLDLSNFDTSSVTDMNAMFYNCYKLQKVILGTKFAFVGTTGYLPIPSADYITGADGKWYTFEGTSYAPEEIPNNVADTYYAAKVEPVLQYWSSGATTDFHNSTYKSKITKIVFKDNVSVPSTAVASWDVSKDKNGSVMAYVEGDTTNGYTLTIGGLGKVYTNPTSNNLFENFTALKEFENIHLFDTSKTTDMYQMFYNCSSLSSIDVSYFDTSKVTDMFGMFDRCSSLTSIDISSWDTSNVTIMDSMFNYCTSLASVDVSKIDTSQVQDMSDLFYECDSLTNAYLGNFDTTSAYDISYMFYGCDNLKTVDISNFDTSNVTDMSDMFYECYKLQEVKLGANFAFDEYSYLPTPDPDYISTADGYWYNTAGTAYTPDEIPSNVADTYYAVGKKSVMKYYGDSTEDFKSYKSSITKIIFKDETSVPSGVTSWDVSDASDGSVMAYIESDGNSGYVLTIGGNGKIYTNKDSSYLFNSFYNLTEIENMNLFDTSNVTDMEYMFEGCESLTSLDVSNFNTSNVTIMYGLFSGCSSLTSLDISNFDTRNVVDIDNMFTNCSGLTTLDVSGFDVSNVQLMYGMFQGCTNLKSLDLRTFDTTNITSFGRMFEECNNLTATISIYGNNVTDYENMFTNAATVSPAKITVNYTSETSTLVDNMIATKSTNSNVVKGTQVTSPATASAFSLLANREVEYTEPETADIVTTVNKDSDGTVTGVYVNASDENGIETLTILDSNGNTVEQIQVEGQTSYSGVVDIVDAGTYEVELVNSIGETKKVTFEI